MNDKNPYTPERTIKEEIVEDLKQVGDSFGPKVTMDVYLEHGNYKTNKIYRYFDSFSDIVREAGMFPEKDFNRKDIVRAIYILSEELGRPPMPKEMDERGIYTVSSIEKAFGKYRTALSEAGYSKEEIDKYWNVDGVSASSEKTSHDDGQPDNFFDSWDDALSEVSPIEGPSKIEENPWSDDTETVVQNELSERYELVRYLQELCTAVLNVRQDRVDEENVNGPMERWATKVAEFWKGEATQLEGYESQHAKRNPFSMKEYREEFGDGEWLSDFECVEVRQPSPTLEAVYKGLLDDAPNEIYLPVDDQTGEAFPVIVDTKEEFDRAVKMLERLPAEPVSADPNTEAGSGFEWTGEDVPDETTDSGELQDVNGVTDRIEQSLRRSGFDTRSELKRASVDDLAEVDGVSKQVAMRIKVDVGG